ncbi:MULTISPECIES: CGNR zinc finger domain-containing protein [unclassified Streptomyces]|uniref:CGNR zinc finger domain-containing protein n=1 Tax=unclassified Streptomyces TaxID=2593676 RepID=UPI0006862855|nr:MULTISPECIES: CGNR zinc finger domain-containing protein [unclassified Streptomyces]MYT29487.1 CGNR zinc finger domain-containing protein [Streptomyces sp. SID8354]
MGSGNAAGGGIAPHGFRPAEWMIDLANAVRAAPELPREALVALLGRHGESADDLTEEAFSERDADELRGAAARIAGLLTVTDTDRAAHALNELMAACGARPRLSRHGGHPWHLHVDRGDDAGWGDWFLASSALALAQILTECGRVPWGECAASGCITLYLGTGPGSARRYCSTACATRERVAAHRRRMKVGG